MLDIESLNLQLPAELETRANNIARQTARCLSDYPLAQSIDLQALEVSGISIHDGEADGVIARRIAKTVHRSIMQQSNMQQLNNGTGVDSNGD